MSRLVVPVGSTTNGAGIPWTEVAAENGCDGVEELGSPWCQANGVDGLGIYDAAVPLPPAPPASPLTPIADLAPTNGELASAVTTVVAALDPQVVNPTTAQRLAAIEAVLARIVSEMPGLA